MNCFEQVVEFNTNVLRINQRQVGPLPTDEFLISVKSLQEEVDEFTNAHELVDSIDAVIDLLYFGIGVLYKHGLTPQQMQECFTAVHNANMEKKIGINAKRNTGAADAIKPAGWVPPEARICEILQIKK